MEYQLGRLPAVDERDSKYPMRKALGPEPVSFLRFWRFWRTGQVLDQGAQPHCVGFAWRQFLQSAPMMTTEAPNGNEIYHEAQKLDEWPGEDYDGTSVRGGAKALSQSWHHVKSYVWAQSPDELKAWVLTKGPVVVGTNWYSSMFDVNPLGEVSVTGYPVGGHAYLIVGYNRITRRYRCLNSWGKGWGQGGRFWMKDKDMHDLLFVDGGEACAAIEQKVEPEGGLS